MASGLRVEAVLEKYPRVETVQTEPEEPTEPPDVQVTSISWTENPGRIQRANLDGSNIQDLITMGLTIPYSLALDLVRGKMYWTEQGTDKIQRANLDGSNIQDLITTGPYDPYGIVLGTR